MQGPWLIVLCGVQYSGKSYLARRLVTSDNDIIISTDEIVMKYAKQHHLSYAKAYDKYYPTALEEARVQFKQACEEGNNIIIDRTNAYPESRKYWVVNVPFDYNKIAVVFSVSIEEVELRMHKRRANIISKEDVLKKMAEFVLPTLEEGFNEVLKAEDLLAVLPDYEERDAA